MALEHNKYSVLVVDDEQMLRQLIATVLKDAGFQTMTANDGEQALALARMHKFDVIVADIYMPGLKGTDLLKQVKVVQPHCEVIIMSGQASLDSAIEATRYGAFDYLQKPFADINELVPVVERAIQKKLTETSKERTLDQLIDQARALLKDLKGATYLVIDEEARQRQVPLSEKILTIGTDANCSIRLKSVGVMPQHASIEATAGGWRLWPKGPLQHQGRLLAAPLDLENGISFQLGAVRFSCYKGQTGRNVESILKQLQQQISESEAEGGFSLTGNLQSTDFFDLVQLIALLKKEGTLLITTEGASGRAIFGQNGVVQADFAGVQNEKALFRLGLLQQGQFEFQLEEVELNQLQNPLKEETSFLLLEICRQADEYRKLSTDVPPRRLNLAVNRDWLLQNPQRSKREQLLLQNIIDEKNVGQLLDRISLPDTEAIKTLIELRRKGALVVTG